MCLYFYLLAVVKGLRMFRALSWLELSHGLLFLAGSLIVIVTTLRQTLNSAANFQILLGTDNVMQWWFYLATPVAWTLLVIRVLQNLSADWRTWRRGGADAVLLHT